MGGLVGGQGGDAGVVAQKATHRVRRSEHAWHAAGHVHHLSAVAVLQAWHSLLAAVAEVTDQLEQEIWVEASCL